MTKVSCNYPKNKELSVSNLLQCVKCLVVVQVKVLKSMRKPNLQDVVLGQYKASVSKDGKSKIPGYLDEPDVPANSLTSTFVAAAFYIDNARWDGVPFLIKAGLGLIKHR